MRVESNAASHTGVDEMLLKTIFGFLFLILSITANSAFSAEIKPVCDLESARDMGCTLVLTGDIQKGDALRLRQVLSGSLKKLGTFRFVLLESRGGDVAEAMKIGDIVKSALLTTTLARLANLDNDDGSTRVCVSACFLIFIAGGDRSPVNGRLGIHRPYFDKETYKNRSPLDIANGQQALEDAVSKYAKKNGVSDELIAKMMGQSSKQVYWLSESETMSLSGEQTWYQEIGIATCNWDPARTTRIMREWKQASASDKKWQRDVYGCMNDQIEKAQLDFVRSPK